MRASFTDRSMNGTGGHSRRVMVQSRDLLTDIYQKETPTHAFSASESYFYQRSVRYYSSAKHHEVSFSCLSLFPLDSHGASNRSSVHAVTTQLRLSSSETSIELRLSCETRWGCSRELVINRDLRHSSPFQTRLEIHRKKSIEFVTPGFGAHWKPKLLVWRSSRYPTNPSGAYL